MNKPRLQAGLFFATNYYMKKITEDFDGETFDAAPIDKDYYFGDEEPIIEEEFIFDAVDPLDNLDNGDLFMYDDGYDDFGDLSESRKKHLRKRIREEFTERDYEADTSGGDPFEEIWRQADAEPNHNGYNKPAIKGTPHFKYEKAKDGNNKPSCPDCNDTYEAKYGGSLNESRIPLDELMESIDQRIAARKRIRESEPDPDGEWPERKKRTDSTKSKKEIEWRKRRTSKRSPKEDQEDKKEEEQKIAESLFEYMAKRFRS